MSMVVENDDSVWTWGPGNYGNLGHNDKRNRFVQTQLTVALFGGALVVMVTCGHFISTVVTGDGALFTCVYGTFGQLVWVTTVIG